jgi:hypothetical protein
MNFVIGIDGRNVNHREYNQTCPDADWFDEECPKATATVSDDWESSTIEEEGYYELYPIGGKIQAIPDDWPRTQQQYNQELKWGSLGMGFGYQLGVSLVEKPGVIIVNEDNNDGITTKYGGILFKVQGEALGSKLDGSAFVDDVPNFNYTITTEKVETHSITEGLSVKTAKAEIQTMNMRPTTHFSNWWINYTDNDNIDFEINSLRTTWDSMSLKFEVTREEFQQVLNPIRTNIGKIDTFGVQDGGFETVDTSIGGCTIHLAPPSSLLPLRYPDEMLVDNMTVEARDNQWETLEVKMKVKRTNEKGNGNPERFNGTLTTGNDWEFEFFNQTIKTDNVGTEVTREASKGSKSCTVKIRTNKLQTKVVEESGNKQNRVLVEDWGHDNERKIRDMSEYNNNTVNIDPPSETEILSKGEYLIDRWNCKWLSGEYHEVKLKLIPKEV